MSSFKPRPYQQQIIRHIITHPRCALFVPMGMGKTGSTLAALETLLTVDDDLRRVLVLAPLRVAVSTWPDEVRKWGFDMTVAAICGTPAQRRKALASGATICTANYEQLPWLVDQLGRTGPLTWWWRMSPLGSSPSGLTGAAAPGPGPCPGWHGAGSSGS